MKKGICIFLAILLLLALAGAGVCAYIWHSNVFTLQLSLAGEEDTVLEYGEPFQDPGATAVFSGTLLRTEPENVEVTVSGQVDTSRVGTYTLTYTAECEVDYRVVQRSFHSMATRKVYVVDTQAPSITLESIPDHFTIPGEPYQEEGFSASDGYDGDLTQKVTVREEDGYVYYTVTDSSGNMAEAVRSIFYNDPIPPELVLTGGDIQWRNGKEYADPGFTATDNADGDITHLVEITTDLDVNTRGFYTVTYTVTDSYGNTATASRRVEVLPVLPDIVLEYPDPALPPNGKVIYLTFDDGPSQYTEKLLDILDKYQVKATFFVVSNKLSDVITEIAARGHTVAMHTASHNYRRIYASQNAYFKDLQAIESLIEAKTGIAPKLLRFPGGSSNRVSSFNPGIMSRLTKAVEDKGYIYYDWNVDSNDAGGATTSIEVLYNTVAGIMKNKNSIVLQHDTHLFSVEAVEDIIRWGLANGYTFAALGEDSPECHHRVSN